APWCTLLPYTTLFRSRFLQTAGGVGGQREGALAVLAPGLAQPQEDAGRLLLGLEADQQDGGRLLQRGVGDARAVEVTAAAGDPGGQEVGLLAAVRPRPEVDVVGAQGHACELAVRVGVLDGEPAAGQDAGAAPGGEQALRRDLQRLGPGGG